jgi:hypothetical protein
MENRLGLEEKHNFFSSFVTPFMKLCSLVRTIVASLVSKQRFNTLY